MKYICFSIFIILFSCNPKSGLHPELEKAIRDYQDKVPIPKSLDFNKYVFVYKADFSLKNGDTIISIVRWPSGIPENSDCYGKYKLENTEPIVIYDEKDLGNKFIHQKIRNLSLKKYQISERKRHYVDYPPVFKFKVNGEKINFVRIDTISDNWIK